MPRRVSGTVAIKLVSDREMAKLNGAFRGKAVPTDVLSFPADDPSPAGSQPLPGGRKSFHDRELGDIAIAIGVARRQARTFGHSLTVELRVLAMHGILHLLGYDHERDRGEMRRIEDRWRRRAGLPAGLVARNHRRSPTTR